jgi:hypothetical protein
LALRGPDLRPDLRDFADFFTTSPDLFPLDEFTPQEVHAQLGEKSVTPSKPLNKLISNENLPFHCSKKRRNISAQTVLVQKSTYSLQSPLLPRPGL